MKQPTSHRFSPRGNGSQQTRIALSVDNDLKDWLAEQPNKNRYINGLIRQHREMTSIGMEADQHGITIGEHLAAIHASFRENQKREAEKEARHRRPRKKTG